MSLTINAERSEVIINVKDKDLVEFCVQHPYFNFKDILKSIPKTFANYNTNESKINVTQGNVNTFNSNLSLEKINEQKLSNLLEELFVNAQIMDKRGNDHSGDFWLIRKDKPKILIENKEYTNKVYIDEVENFIYNAKYCNMSGIMISQKSSIIHRNNFEFEIIGDNVIVFLSEMNYDINKLRSAIDIIDNITNRLSKGNGDIHIDRITLERINKTYQMYHYKKQEQLSILKQSYDACTKSIEEFDFDIIYDLLTENGIQTNVKKWVCELCNRIYPTEKGLKTHFRSCSEKKNVHTS